MCVTTRCVFKGEPTGKENALNLVANQDDSVCLAFHSKAMDTVLFDGLICDLLACLSILDCIWFEFIHRFFCFFAVEVLVYILLMFAFLHRLV